MTIRRIVLLTAVLSASSCATNSAIQDCDTFLEQGYLKQAFERIEDEYKAQLADGSVDPEVKAYYDRLRFEATIAQARLSIYRDDEVRGRELLAQAAEMRPGDAEVAELETRALRKLAARTTQRGQEHLAKGELELALASFAEAQRYVPDYKEAKAGVQAVQSSVAKLHSEAQRQFIAALRKLPEFRYSEVEWHARAAVMRDESRSDAASLRDRAERELADEAKKRAEANRSEKQYGAALMDYRAGKSYWPQMPGVDDFITQMQREMEVLTLTERAQLAIKADRLDEARALLDEAFEKSTLERGSINELRFGMRKRAGELAYAAARDLELQGFKSEALAAYQKLVADWPDGLLDERTRVGALQSDIAGAEREFAVAEEAEAKGDLTTALDHYQSARTWYEKYRDVDARIARVKAKLPAQKAGGS